MKRSRIKYSVKFFKKNTVQAWIWLLKITKNKGVQGIQGSLGMQGSPGEWMKRIFFFFDESLFLKFTMQYFKKDQLEILAH
jgi:hypothetical protein